MSDAYEMIDRFLRNNLDDDDYAEFSAALDSVAKAGEALAERDAKLAALEEGVVTEEMKMAVRWAPSSAYWSTVLVNHFGPDARDGINSLEKQLREKIAASGAALAERDAKLAALEGQEGQEPVGVMEAQYKAAFYVDVPIGYKLYAAAGAAPVPQGYQLVPVEPTDEMIYAGYWSKNRSNIAIYKAMLAAAPKEPT